MNLCQKIYISLFFLFASLNFFGQKDSIKKQQVFLSLSVGIPLHNQIGYTSDYPYFERKAYSKSKS